MSDIEKGPAPITPASHGGAPIIGEDKHELSPAPSHGSAVKRPSLDHKPTEVEELRKHDDEEIEESKARQARLYQKFRPFIIGGSILVILGWWISGLFLERSLWIPHTVWAWFFILVLAFRYIPNWVVTKPVEAVWGPLVSRPFFALPYAVRLGLGFFALVGIVIGSAFGFPLPENTTYVDRVIPVIGLLVYQLGFIAVSKNRSAIPWPTVVVGLFAQQAIALFVLKTQAGQDIFTWVANLAGDFLFQGSKAAEFFFDAEVVEKKHWFFVGVLGSIIFFIAFVQMMYYVGAMQWLIGKFAWFFFKIMNISGAEAVVAAASPWVGQGESACLVRPYVDVMTDSEIHLTMTSGFSTIAGSVLGAYISLGVPPQHLVTASVMSIPASIAISKMRLPEMDEPVTRGQVVIDRGHEDKAGAPANALHAFSRGATFGLIVAGQILANVLTILALVYVIDGLLRYIGNGFSIQELSLKLILGYIFYPLAFFLGVPRGEILTVSRLLGTKLVANEFVAYLDLTALKASGDISERAFVIATYCLCGFANLASVGIQIGVLGALAPSRAKVIARLAVSAMLCGFISTMQTATIAGMLV
jgi:CNT family concentrative nucleoside transporter